MSLKRQALRVFGLKKAPPPRSWHSVGDENPTLSYLGYPELVLVDFFLPCHVLTRWKAEHMLLLPDKCCVCLLPACLYLPVYKYSKWLGLRQGRMLDPVPHCENHGLQEEARLIVQASSWTEVVVHMSLIGLNKAFLDEARSLNQAGDVFPPWKAFPGYDPFHPGWRQGNREYWLTYVWKPFWAGLSDAEQEQYLDRWMAPEDWRKFMPLDVKSCLEKRG